VAADTLPQVSWIVAPYKVCEHPSAMPAAGEDLTARLIAALAANPEVWAKTAIILNYDENDGFFDHMPPLVPPIGEAPGKSTVALDAELYEGVPVGLGPRVPMIVVSPWTKGGWVNSQLFDHTSVIRLLEARFGVPEPQITPWRRALMGDLTSVFDFEAGDRKPNPGLPDASGLPARALVQATLPTPRPPSAPTTLPRQEPGGRPARALPYAFEASVRMENGDVELTIANTGAAGAGFTLYPTQGGQGGPWSYAVEAGKTLQDHLPAGPGGYDLTLHGPNGFLRRFRGGENEAIEVTCRPDAEGGVLHVLLRNTGAAPVTVMTANAYSSGKVRRLALAPGMEAQDAWSVVGADHWYDVSVTLAEDPLFLRSLAGHIETGRPSRSDPALNWPAPV
jgi:phospholipase C